MREFFAERKLLIITGVIAVGIVVFAVTRSPGHTSNTSADTFKTVDTNSSMSMGESDAPVSIIQYSDFICPSCSYFSTQVMPTIKKDYIDTGKAKFEFRPMAFIADGSTQAGMGAYCAIDQEKFWTYHDTVYASVVQKVFQQGLDPKSDVIFTKDDVKKIASTAGLDGEQFNTCMSSDKHLKDITSATTAAQKNGINSTPYIMVNGHVYKGDVSLSAFDAFIKAQL